jgi:hypothetical protein
MRSQTPFLISSSIGSFQDLLCNGSGLVRIIGLNKLWVTCDIVCNADFLDVLFKQFIDFYWRLWTFEVSFDHLWSDLFELRSNLGCDDWDLLEREVILFSQLSVNFNKVISEQRLEASFFDIVFDKETDKSWVKKDLPTVAIDAPMMRGFL